jgi:hypothetical protein
VNERVRELTGQLRAELEAGQLQFSREHDGPLTRQELEAMAAAARENPGKTVVCDLRRPPR